MSYVMLNLTMLDKLSIVDRFSRVIKNFLIISFIKNILILCLLRISHCHITLIDLVYSSSRLDHHNSNYFKLFLKMMIQYSSMTTATWLQQNCNDDVLILQDTILENERCIMKSESEEAEDELSLDIDEQLTCAMLQRNELQKKQKLAAIQSEIETLQVIETMKRSHSAFIQAFTWALIKNLNDLRIISIVSTMTKWIHHEIVLQKRRLSMLLKKYHDKIIRKHKEWIRDVEISFWNTSWHFESDEKKILYCMIYLKSESKKLWFDHKETMSAAQQTWFNFIDFLLNLIENSMNRDINVTQQYVNASQRSDQMIRMFAAHLSILKHQLSLYSDEHKWAHLFIKLRSELRVIITNVQSISITWDALIDLVAWLKTNLRKEHVLLLKQSQDEDLHNWDRINKKTHLKRKKSYWSTRLDSLSKTSLHTSSHYSKNLFNITCYTCNQKNHYFTDCKDEKIKNKSKESDVNRVFIDLMSHVNHFKISKKDKLLTNASNHRGKNKKFSL